MSPVILFAPRFAGSRFLEDMLESLGAWGTPQSLEVSGKLAKPLAAELARKAQPVVVLGLPKLALSLAPILSERLTLVLDGTEGLEGNRISKLRSLRVASFSWRLYTAARRADIDAAFFAWAPPPSAFSSPGAERRAGRTNDAFIETGAGYNRRTLAKINAKLRIERIFAAKPRGPLERLRQFLMRGVETLEAEPAEEVAEQSGVYIASRRRAGLDGGFFAAMARGATVVAPDCGLFPQLMTHGVSGLLEGELKLAAADRSSGVGDAAARGMRRARRRFDDDRKRFADFLTHAPTDAPLRRTTARVTWEPAPKAGAPTQLAPDTLEGGKRLREEIRDDLPGAPLVTVAIVVRNARESFAPTLASILAQDYPNMEIIVVDGASTDGTLDEIRARSSHLDYWISERDSGPYDGMNKAARLARGRFLIFMNAGDCFAHERAVSDAFEDPAMAQTDVIVGHHVYVGADGVERLCKNADFNETARRLAAGKLSWAWYNGVPCGQAVFIRSELLRELPFDLTYRIAADHAFLYRAQARGRRFAHCDSVIGVYTSGGFSGADDRSTAAELLRIARTHGPREQIDTWFRRNLPIAFEHELA